MFQIYCWNAIDRWMAAAICKTPLRSTERASSGEEQNFSSLFKYLHTCCHFVTIRPNYLKETALKLERTHIYSLNTTETPFLVSVDIWSDTILSKIQYSDLKMSTNQQEYVLKLEEDLRRSNKTIGQGDKWLLWLIYFDIVYICRISAEKKHRFTSWADWNQVKLWPFKRRPEVHSVNAGT